MASNLLLRRRLFDLYATNLQHCYVDVPHGYVCPICGDGYYRRAVEPETLALTLAHTYPESCGGPRRLSVLACGACNARIGDTYEHHLKRDYLNMAALSGQGTASVQARMYLPDGSSMGVTASRNEHGFAFREIAAQTNPKHRENFMAFPPPGEPYRFSFVVQQPSDRHVAVALLHSAYLLLFRYFGYEYFHFGNCQRIRAVLMSEEPPEQKPFVSLDLNPADVGDATRFTSTLFMPYGVQVDWHGGRTYCLGVPLPSPDNRIIARLILMPGFGDEAGEAYRRFHTEFDQKTPLTFSMSSRLDAEDEPELRLKEERSIDYGRMWWGYVCKHLAKRTDEK